MKITAKFLLLSSILIGLALAMRPVAPTLNGAWRLTNTTGKTVLVTVADGYLMWTEYAPNRFVSTRGGAWQQEGRQLKLTVEFDSRDSIRVGQVENLPLSLSNAQMTLGSLNFERIDEPSAQTPLAGLWRITGREGQDGQMGTMQRGARKTIKLLTGTRFQWAAINPQTKQFSGCGGGTYTMKDGKYTETIDFFSRDNTRVGRSLSFDYSLSGDVWDHRGMSSTGGKVHEAWSRERP
ncbi:MAG: membrane or secreted protein [Cytophagaceae bacterium]|nr:membrane or secreted protein [Cytophagaceae bacterium]